MSTQSVNKIDLFASTTDRISDSGSPWSYFNAGPFTADDGIFQRKSDSLIVTASARHPETDQPMFNKSIPQEKKQTGEPLPGGLDHPKWLVYSQQPSSQGIPGFDCPEEGEITIQSQLGVRSFGTENHPFGDAVRDDQDDLRLGAGAMSIVDMETLVIFDFLLTNRGIYAFYERLPYAREALGRYASFSFARRVADRQPDEFSRLAIAYNRGKGVVRWFVGDNEVMRVDKIGHLIDRKYLVLDHGGAETHIAPKQLACGFGVFTLLDAAGHDGRGLARLSSAEDFYFTTDLGEPAKKQFVDEESVSESRLFGQGAELVIKEYSVTTQLP